MGKRPIKMLLDGIMWKALPGVHYATHEGELHIEGFTLKVYQLNTGQRVIDANDFTSFLEGKGLIIQGGSETWT